MERTEAGQFLPHCLRRRKKKKGKGKSLEGAKGSL